MAHQRKRQVMESMFPVIELVVILLACVEFCGAGTVVDVYRLIQYDISGVPFGSRFAALNHHAASTHFPPGSDLSRTVLIIPFRDLNISFVKEYISQRQPLGGLLFLLPRIFSFENKDDIGSNHQDHASEQIKNLLAELEQLLLHSNIPYPVYFAFEDSDTEAVLADIKRNDATGQPATATTGGSGWVSGRELGSGFGMGSRVEGRGLVSRSDFGTRTGFETDVRVFFQGRVSRRGVRVGVRFSGRRRDLGWVSGCGSGSGFGVGDGFWDGGWGQDSGQGYKLVVSVPEPKKVASPTITNIQGWLPGLKTDGDNQLPTIAIVASYDTFGAAPALSVGSDSNGSGVVALLEIARLFSFLYSNPKTRGRYNLLFGLTSGGPYNYNGTHKWLRSFDQRLRESIDFAICLNSVGSWDNELWIHVSKPPENAYIKQIFEGFSNVAEELGFKVGLKHKKINISNPRVAWEHEQFSRMRVTAATLSELSVTSELFERTGGLVDSRGFTNETAVIRSVKLIAESLAACYSRLGSNFGDDVLEVADGWSFENVHLKHIYGQEKNMEIFADDSSLAVNPFYIRSWLEFLSRKPRVAPFISKNDPLVLALKKELEDHTHEVNIQHEVLDGMFTFYDSSRARLNIYQVASVTFDLLLLLVLGSYLIVLFSFLVITTRGLDDLISIFRRPPSRKVKTA
ncbi:hypothetical protein TIFTF001_037365 [Ficus carica]|uniref:Nicalin n=1 Tax=Ficus carica TaxID=3494 RepID=A0AA88E662_FICCA|nr:hypothetical protein TIFTF001_037365 [Ficus carica]